MRSKIFRNDTSKKQSFQIHKIYEKLNDCHWWLKAKLKYFGNPTAKME